MKSPIRISIIGCGAIAREHARCLQQTRGAVIRSCTDVDTSRARAFAREFDIRMVAESTDDVFRDREVDVVYICTRNDSHHALAVAGARAGKHLFIEKPLALTVGECDGIGEAVEKAGVICSTGFKFRFYPSVRRAFDFIDRPLVTIAQIVDDRWEESFWANDPAKGGGNILSQGCHIVDLAWYLNRSEPVRVYAEGGNYTHRSLPIYDNMAATVLFANGSIASIVIGDSGHSPVISKVSLQVSDGKKSAHLHNRMKSATLFDGEQYREFHDHEELGILEETRAFIGALQNDRQPPVTTRDGIRTTLVLLGAFASIRTGQPQEIRI